MGLASIELAIMADRVQELRASARRDQIARSARRAYTRSGQAHGERSGGHAAAAALRDLVSASLASTNR